jgi:hypothetical protein
MASESSSASSPSAAAAPTLASQSTRVLHIPDGTSLPETPIRLGPNDWILPPQFTIGLLYFYRHPSPQHQSADGTAEGSAPPFMDAEALARSLEHLLRFYPLLSGRFVRNDAEGTLEIASLGSGVPFITASTDTKIDDLPISSDRFTGTRALPYSLSLMPPFDYANPTGGPLLSVQHTRFGCGGVCLGVQLHHYVADMEGFVQMMEDWTELHRALAANKDATPQLSVPPTLDRSLFGRMSKEDIERRLQGHTELTHRIKKAPAAAASAAPAAAEPAPGSTPITRCFRFEADELARIKQAATPPASSSASSASAAKGGQAPWVSTFEALAAHLSRAAFRARHPELVEAASSAAAAALSKPVSSKLYIATNWRARLRDPPCPPRYFGNAALYTSLRFPDTAAALSSPAASLSDTAAQLHAAIAANDGPAHWRTMAWISAQTPKDSIEPAFDDLAGDDFAVTSWLKFGMHASAEFERGATPVRVCLPPFPGMPGVAILFPTPDEGPRTRKPVAQGQQQQQQQQQSSSSGVAAPSVAPSPPLDSPVDVLLGLSEAQMTRLEADKEFRKFK